MFSVWTLGSTSNSGEPRLPATELRGAKITLVADAASVGISGRESSKGSQPSEVRKGMHKQLFLSDLCASVF